MVSPTARRTLSCSSNSALRPSTSVQGPKLNARSRLESWQGALRAENRRCGRVRGRRRRPPMRRRPSVRGNALQSMCYAQGARLLAFTPCLLWPPLLSSRSLAHVGARDQSSMRSGPRALRRGTDPCAYCVALLVAAGSAQVDARYVVPSPPTADAWSGLGGHIPISSHVLKY